MSLKISVYDLLICQEYERALKHCQNMELQIQEECIFNDGDVNSVVHGFDFYGWYMICLLFLENLNEAKYLWKRVPAQVKSENSSAVIKLWEIGSFLWENHVNKAFNEINSHSWSTDIQPLVLRLKSCIFLSQVKSLGKLFAALSVSKISQLLYLPEAEVVELCHATEIPIHTDGTLSIPSEYASDFIQQQAIKFSRDGQVVQDLANYVSALEQEPLKVDLSNKKGGGKK